MVGYYSSLGFLFVFPFRSYYPFGGGGGGRFAMDSVGMNIIVKKGRMLDGDLNLGGLVDDVIGVVPYVEVDSVTIYDIHRYFQLYSLLRLLENGEVGVNSKLDALERNNFVMQESGLRGFRLTHGLFSDW